VGERVQHSRRAYTPQELDELEQLIIALAAFDSQVFSEQYQEFFQQQEPTKVNLLQRVRSFLFQPIVLDASDQNFAIAFTGGMR
jgi:hypothetical protein